MNDSIDRIKKLLEEAIAGPISLEYFYEKYDDHWEQNPLYLAILDNVESFLEHLPGERISVDINVGKHEYKVMQYDYDLLNKVNASNEGYLLAKRQLDILKI